MGQPSEAEVSDHSQIIETPVTTTATSICRTSDAESSKVSENIAINVPVKLKQLQKCTLQELKDYCVSSKLSASGSKKELISRLDTAHFLSEEKLHC